MKYKSKLEEEFHSRIGKSWDYEMPKIDYVIPQRKSSYTPDFAKVIPGVGVVYLETKGRFRTRAEAQKYLHIRKSLGKDEQLVFILQGKNAKMPGKEGRKSKVTGQKLKKETMEQWLTRHGFKWFYAKDFKEGYLRND